MAKKRTTEIHPIVRMLFDKAGGKIVRCSPDWGGTYGVTKAGITTQVCGYKTEEAAMEGFVIDSAGSSIGRVMLKMLKDFHDKAAKK